MVQTNTHLANSETATGSAVPERPALTVPLVGIGAANLMLSAVLCVAVGVPALLMIVFSFAFVPLFGLGFILMAITFLLLRVVMNVERARVRGVYGLSVPPLTLRSPDPSASWFTRFFRPYFTREFWRSVGHMFLAYLIGFVAFVMVVFLFGAGIGSFFLHPKAIGYRVGFATIPPDFAPLMGILLIVVALALLWAFVALDRALHIALLERTEEQLRVEVSTLTDANLAAETAAAVERSRIERDLHDGAQHRLVNLAMTLGMAKSKLDIDPDAARALLDEAHAEAKASVQDLREIARGIQPAILTDRGLDAALSALAASSHILTRVTVDLQERVSASAESVAYFVVAEALTNATKYSSASRIDVVANRDGNLLRVTVIDNGVGGATIHADGEHTGLAGLQHRVRAARGTFQLTSPAGGPTIITAEIPFA